MEDLIQRYIVYAATDSDIKEFKEIQLLLHDDKIVFTDKGREIRCFQLRNVVGLKVIGVENVKSNSASHNCDVELCVFSEDSNIPLKRRVKFICFSFNSFDTFEANKEAAIECRQSIQNYCLKNDASMKTTGKHVHTYRHMHTGKHLKSCNNEDTFQGLERKWLSY